MSPYVYRPLVEGEIRTLLLQSSSATDSLATIHIEIVHRRLDDQAQYEALSYTWGDTTTLYEISCNEGTIRITENLKAALLRLRQPLSPRELWVDAVCIDQSNEVEKQGQIAIMRHIFGTATKTIVWLGEETEDVAVAIDFFNHQQRRIMQALANYMNLHRAMPEDLHDFIRNVSRDLGASQEFLFTGYDQQRTQRAIAHLLARPWFRRVWTVQEFIVAKKIEMRCGDLTCTSAFAIPNFAYAFDEARLTWHGSIDPSRRQDMFTGMTQMLQLQTHRNEYQDNKQEDSPIGFFDTLRTYRRSQATVPEDHIWAFQSLAYTGGISSRLSSLAGSPKRALYVALATHYIQLAGSGHVDMLSEASRSPRHGSDLPSWVPDWSEKPIRINYAHLHSMKTRWFYRAGGRPVGAPESCFYVRGEILHTVGYNLCNISCTGEYLPDRITGAPNLSHAVSAGDSLQRFVRHWQSLTYFNGERIQDVAVPTLLAGRTHDLAGLTTDIKDDIFVDPLGDLEVDAPIAPAHEDTDTIDLLKALVGESPNVGRNLARATAGRRAAICVNSEQHRLYLGLFPAECEEGDQIYILRACAVPVLLRPVDDGRFRLIGDCYVHGVMEGELVDECVWRDIEIE